MTDIVSELHWRGLIQQTTEEKLLREWLNGGPRSVYAGFDPTAASLHVGSLLPLLTLRRFQFAGHRPIALVGGATGMIGDPSGKSQERNLLSSEQLQQNVAGQEQQMRRFLDFSTGTGAILVNNLEWMSGFSYLEFLRDVGKNFPVNVMLAKDSVKSRLGRDDAGLSYTEFSYMLLQAYDFVHLLDKYDCRVQIGGSDQWGNITAGIDLARRMKSTQIHGITHPLLTKADGTKMGKTETGAVWLDAQRTSPYQFYQYLKNVADEDAGKCLRLLCDLDESEIKALDESREQQPEKRESQVRLAEELTKLVHGPDQLAVAKQATDIFFGAEIADLNDSQLEDVFADVPSKTYAKSTLDGAELGLIDALVDAGLAKSKGEARRTIQQGGAYVNNQRRSEIEARLSTADLASESMIVLRSGRKKYALLRFE